MLSGPYDIQLLYPRFFTGYPVYSGAAACSWTRSLTFLTVLQGNPICYRDVALDDRIRYRMRGFDADTMD